MQIERSQTSSQLYEYKEAVSVHSAYSKIYNIFPEYAYQEAVELCKSHPAYYEQVIYTYPEKTKMYNYITFDSNHKLVNSMINEGVPKSPEINKIVEPMVERFAEELKLVGDHGISVRIYRKSYSEEITDMRGYQLQWHWDHFAKSSMIAVFHNDFSYDVGLGLDIAENISSEPHHPISPSIKDKPKDDSISCEYPPNGAIILHHLRGAILHRNSLMKTPSNVKASRCVILIKLIDKDWPFDGYSELPSCIL